MRPEILARHALDHTRPDRRFATRSSVEIEANIHKPGDKRITATITDFSLGGCRFDGSDQIAVGRDIMIHIPGFYPFDATVTWAETDRFGCAFADTLDPSISDHLIARSTGTVRD